MKLSRLIAVAHLAVLMGLAGFAAAPPAAQKQKPETVQPTHEVIQTFPSNDIMQTAWKVRWATTSGYGLTIQDAWFKRGPKDAWMQILGDARLAEMFVPYHSGSPRFWDVSYNFSLVTLNKEAAGPFGKLHGDPPVVAQEIRA